MACVLKFRNQNKLLDMEICINNLGLSFEKIKNTIPKEVVLIKNTDKSIRWIIPKAAKKAHFLKFYAITNFRSKAMAFVLKTAFNFKLTRLLFTTKTIYVTPGAFHKSIDFNTNEWAIFTGTKGPNRKLVVSFPEQKQILKVALNKASKSLLKIEHDALNQLNSLNMEAAILPKSEMLSKNVLVQNDIAQQGKRSADFSIHHKNALTALYEHTLKKVHVFDLPIYQEAQQRLQTLKETANTKLFPQGILRKLNELQKSIKNEKIAVAFSHGDFTPWNMYAHNDKIAIYDWELSNSLCPVGYDAFHFILQNSILTERLNFEAILNKIQNKITQEDLNKWAGEPVDYSLYLKLFLYFHITYYAALYAKQASWHQQVYWQLEIWTQALNPFLKHAYSQRKLLIMDLFDFLHNKKYSTLKFHNNMPENLSELSDIDLIAPKKSFKELKNYFKNHPLVNSIHSQKRSFKGDFQLFTKDQSFLSLDIIWKLKRKELLFLDVKKLLKKTSFNAAGVKVLDAIETARYIGFFYSLNKQPIPSKFQEYSGLLDKSYNRDDAMLFSQFSSEKPNPSGIKKMLRKKKPNKSFNRVKNLAHYLIDTTKDILSSKGMWITFSGVDGAGKSTIIEQTREILVKKYRKKVVVIRHRPSLLPILSAWTKGKQAAEQHAAKTLPRQGTNTSTISSLFRFGYYYADYLFGQFYIYVKHSLRGEIVLYDRYYFDFINDSLRSNIRLPKWLTKGAYIFLLKPHFNFFLYADAKTILSRKEELDANTIERLTADYLHLFKSLNKTPNTVYCAIENIKIEDTLAIIFSKSAPKLF